MMMKVDLDDVFYETKGSSIKSLGKLYQPPPRIEYGVWTLVASIPKSPPSGDGMAVEVWESRYPAAFYKVVAIAGPNSCGEMRQGFTLESGSGTEAAELMGKIAMAISIGMLTKG